MAINIPAIVLTADDKASAVIDKVAGKLAQWAGAALGVASVSATLKAALDFGDMLQTTSERLGISVERLSTLSAVAVQSGTSVEGFGKAFRTLSQSMVAAGDANSEQARLFKALGVEIRDANGNLRSMDAVFQETAAALQNVGSETTRLAAGAKLMGRGYMEVAAAAATYSDALEQAQEMQLQFGVVTTQAAKAADSFGDRLKLIWEGIKTETLNGLTTGFISLQVALRDLQPFIAQIADSFGKFFGWLATYAAPILVRVAQGFQLLGTAIGGYAAAMVADDPNKKAFILAELHKDLAAINATADVTIAKLKLVAETGRAPNANLAAWAEANNRRNNVDDNAVARAMVPVDKTQSRALEWYTQQLNALNEAAGRLSGEDGGLSNYRKTVDAIAEAQLRGLPITQAQIEALYKAAGALDEVIARIKERKNLEEQSAAMAQAANFALAIERENEARQFEIELIGKTRDEQMLLIEAHRIDNAVRAEYIRISNAIYAEEMKGPKDANQGLIDLLTKQLQMLPQLGEAWKAESLAAIQSQQAAQSSFAVGWQEAFNQYQEGLKGASIAQEMFNDLTRSMETLFVGMTHNAKNAFRDFTDAILDMLAQIAAKIAVSGILQLLGLGGGGKFNIGGVSIDLGMGGGGGGAGGILGTVGSWFGLGGGGAAAASSAGYFGATGASIGASEAVGISGAAEGAGLGAMGGGGGGMLATLAPYAAVAMVAYSLISGYLAKKKGGPKVGGFYAQPGFDLSGTGYTDASGRWFTPNNADTEVKSLVDKMSTSYDQMLKSLGGTGSAQFGFGYDTDPQGKALSNVHSAVRVNGQLILNQTNPNVARDDAALQSEIDLQTKRALLAALQASELPAYIADFLGKVDASTASAETIDRLIAMASALKSVTDMVEGLPTLGDKITEGFGDDLRDAFDKAGESLRELLGTYDGSAEATAALTTATSAYYQSLVALVTKIRQVKESVDAMFGGTRESIYLSQRSDAFKYDYYQKRYTELTSQLAGAKSPEQVQKIAEQINQAINDAFGVLSPEQQDALREKFLAELTGVQDTVDKKLADLEKAATSTAAVDLGDVKQALLDAANKMASSSADNVVAANLQIGAANTQWAAAQTPIDLNITLSGPATSEVGG